MRVTYDPAADAAHLYLVERGSVARTEEAAPGLMLDLDPHGEMIGVEILGISKLPGARPMQMAFELLSTPFERAERRPMHMTYDREADAAYLYLRPEEHEVEISEEVAPGVVLDFDRDGRVVGIEILAIRTLPGAKPLQMTFEVLTPSDAAVA